MKDLKQETLVRVLVRKTDAGDLEWKNSVDEDVFQVSIKENTIRLSKVEGPHGLDYYVTLINDFGQEVDVFSDEDLDADTGQRLWYGEMKGLYERARRVALGSDQVLRKLLDDLEDEDEF